MLLEPHQYERASYQYSSLPFPTYVDNHHGTKHFYKYIHASVRGYLALNTPSRVPNIFA